MRSIARWGVSILWSLGCTVSAQAAPCVAQPLDDYLTLGAGGCDIGAFHFSDFTLLGVLGSATPVDPAGVGLTPISGAPGTGFTLTFPTAGGTARLPAGAGEFVSLRLGFEVAAANINGASAALLDPVATGDGVVTLLEDFCLGSGFDDPANLACGGPTAPTLVALTTELFSDPAVAGAFDPTGILGVVADIGIDGGLAGTNSLAGADLRFTTAAAPAPSMLLLLAIGALAGVAVVRRPALTRMLR